jgi:ABC-type nitrate/sulfonate/bicarbonate transport system substrate-binding protein
MLTLTVPYPSLKSYCLALAALAVLLLASAANAESKGELIVGGKPIPLTNAYAYLTKGFFDETKNETVVLLTDAPVNHHSAARH